MTSVGRAVLRQAASAAGCLLPSFAVVVLLWVWATPASAHGAAVTVEPAQARAGDHIKVAGEDFEPNSTVAIRLEGIRATIDLGEVTADADGSFTADLTLPLDAIAGTYQLKAEGGDDSVTVDFSISGSAEGPGSQNVVFERSTGETVTIGIIVVAFIAAGMALVLSGTHRWPSSGQP